jgi:hypothetical protein
MKWFLIVCALAAGLGVAAVSCGPQKEFCPTTNTNTDPNDFTCHARFDAVNMGNDAETCEVGLTVCPGGVTVCGPCP